MNRSALTLTLEQLLEFLHLEGRFLLSPQAKEAFVLKTSELLEKAKLPAEVLYVGILGGTGVGKSTLINALACEEISHPSDRRPFTDRAVVYRHKNTPRGLNAISGLIRDPDALHESDIVKDLILIDLPDFDSVEEDNRRTVLEILPFLDSVIWVVSPEKYADAVFYSFLQQTTINRENFTFVFNKADQLITDGKVDPFTKLKEVLGDFTFRLEHEAGLEQPRIFSLSGAYAFEGKTEQPVLTNEFRKFRDFLMVRRDAKEIAAVKTVNLVEETQRLMNELNSSIQPKHKAALLNAIGKVQAETSEEKPALSLRAMDCENRLAAALFPLLISEDRSIGPVRWAMRVLNARAWGGLQTSESRLTEIFEEASEALAKDRRADLDRSVARIRSEMVLALGHTEASQTEEDLEELIRRAIVKASTTFAQTVAGKKKSLRGGWSRWRRFGQKLVLWAPVLVLILRLSGQGSVESWLDHPSFTGGLKIVLGFLTSLFSSDGLTGLAVLIICELVLIWYLAARRIRKLEKDSRSLARAAVSYVDRGLDIAAQRIQDHRKETFQHIREGLDRLDALNAALPATNRLTAFAGIKKTM